MALFADDPMVDMPSQQHSKNFGKIGSLSFIVSDKVDSSNWSASRLWIKDVVDSKRFDAIMGLIILGNVVVILIETNANAACETSKDPSCDAPQAVKVLNSLFLTIYTIELLTRFYAYRSWLFYSFWKVLDILVVASGLIDLAVNIPNLTVIRVFRLLRVFRTARLLSQFPELNNMMRGFGSAMKAMFWGLTIIVVMLGLWALLAVEFIHPVNQRVEHTDTWCYAAFDSVENAILFFFQTLVAGDSWGTCTIPIVRENSATVFIFALALVSVQLGFTNLILAVIVDAAQQAKDRDHESKLQEKKKYEKECINVWRNAVESLDVDKSGSISIEELKQGYQENPEVSKLLELLDIEWQDLETLFRLMDSDNSGDVSYEQFFRCLRRAHAQDMRMYLMNVKLLITHMATLITEQLALMKEGFAGTSGAGTSDAGADADTGVDVDPAVPTAPSEASSPNTMTGELDEAKDLHRPRPLTPCATLPTDTGSVHLVMGQPNEAVEAQTKLKASVEEAELAYYSAVNLVAKVDASLPAVQELDPMDHVQALDSPSADPGGVSPEFVFFEEPSLASSFTASLDKLRTELEQRLDEIAHTAAAAAVTLEQSTKSLEALVVSCATEGAPAALDSDGSLRSRRRSPVACRFGRHHREHRALHAVMQPHVTKVTSGSSQVPAPRAVG